MSDDDIPDTLPADWRYDLDLLVPRFSKQPLLGDLLLRGFLNWTLEEQREVLAGLDDDTIAAYNALLLAPLSVTSDIGAVLRKRGVL
jgi:hypothetical protein